MQSMFLTHGNGQIWLGTSLVVLKFILVYSSTLPSAIVSSQKNIHSHSDNGKIKECFRRYVS